MLSTPHPHAPLRPAMTHRVSPFLPRVHHPDPSARVFPARHFHVSSLSLRKMCADAGSSRSHCLRTNHMSAISSRAIRPLRNRASTEARLSDRRPRLTRFVVLSLAIPRRRIGATVRLTASRGPIYIFSRQRSSAHGADMTRHGDFWLRGSSCSSEFTQWPP